MDLLWCFGVGVQKKSKNNNKENEGEQRITVTRTEIKKYIRGFPREGVESVQHVEGNTNKQTVISPSRSFRKAVENVQQASPLPKKDKKNDKKKKKNGDGGGERKTKKDVIDKPKEKLEQKKSNEEFVQPQVATAMLKVHSHCDCIGCSKKIQKVVTKTIGYHQIAIDGANGQVTVKGLMDMNALAKSLKRQLKRDVEIMPLSPQKKDEKKEKSGCDDKDGGERNIGGEGDGEKTEKSYGDTKKPTVIGKVDPAKKYKIFQRVSPIFAEQDKNNNNKKKENGGGIEERKEKKIEAKAKPKEKPEVTKSNEPGMTTAVLEVDLCCNCEECTQNIQKVVINTTGYRDMTVDGEKVLVTVTGSMDMKVLAESLRQQLNKDVQILATEANGGREQENSGGERKAGGESGGYGGENLDQYQFGYPYRSPAHGYPTQIFSDENPNYCSIM